MKQIKEYGKGIVLCVMIASVAWLLAGHIAGLQIVGAPVLGILMGMVGMRMVSKRNDFKVGIAFTSKKILQYAVILLGFGLNLGAILEVGSTSLPIILSTITTALVVAFVVSKALRVPSKTAILVGVGSSICGGSAIAATAPVIEADDKTVAQSISVIFLFNVIAALVFPFLGNVLHLSNTGFSLFAGTAINDTSSVTAAASSWDMMHKTGNQVLSAATIVKLTRTIMILPITLVLSLRKAHDEKKQNKDVERMHIHKNFPMFILYFILASAITTLAYWLCSDAILVYVAQIFAFFTFLSKFFIVMAMVAIGLNTDVVDLVRTGGKPILLGFICWVSIALVSLGVQVLLGIY